MPYRKPGNGPALDVPPAHIHDVIGLAWRLCRARRDERVGPKPKKPPAWNLIARVIYAVRYDAWNDRRREYAFMTPDKMDLLLASQQLRADRATQAELMRAYDAAHGKK